MNRSSLKMPSPSPALSSENANFGLNMSFNRHGPTTDPETRFACDLDPLVSAPTFKSHRPVPSEVMENATPEEWMSHFQRWTFPIRTDRPRGLTWGPFANLNEKSSMKNLSSDSKTSSSSNKRTLGPLKQEFNSSLNSKRVRLIPILRNLPEPKIMRSKVKSSYPALTKDPAGNTFSTFALDPSASLDSYTCVKVSVSTSKNNVPGQTRITLCAASQRKYCS
ncbi:hypothetical protein CROQUDRAFT_649762 [Cronartium quercuum f. sp. fusiforme G11]|uniref:Uncharacterized protein n=1 Tax=Cronartium quercuum f. sp. fusiforme G11 TaxID=708437 RepID=A0A9P6NU94_9BASI|nr:hypothetical protein CROQUDRAFT_649762 [Cronartium quercuum f. sp. fusiforme G11]